MPSLLRRLASAAMVLAALAMPAFAQQDDAARSALHLLDYIAVDYAGAVENGRVKSEDEYREQQEFSGQVTQRVESLPSNPAHDALVAQARKLQSLVASKASAVDVANAARTLNGALVQAYHVATAPRSAPDLARGASLFAAQCSSCHGASGHGDGPAARTLTPPPANLADRERMKQRSPFGIYNTVTLGVAGTAMPSFGTLPDEDRWALAFEVATLSAPDALRAKGRDLADAKHVPAGLEDWTPLASLSPDQVQARYGADGEAAQAYLLAHPEAMPRTTDPLALAHDRVARAVEAYRKGDRHRASDLAIEAYLEGFELIERTLAQVDSPLMTQGERAMMDLRGAIDSGAPVARVEEAARNAQALLSQSRERLAGERLSAPATFAASLIILLREGLEAVLVLAAIFAFLGKVGRNDAKRYAHAGWIAALVLGLLTWYVSAKLIAISGASREVTEGVTALVSAAMLLYVGFWLHDKTHADAWQAFIRGRVGGALSGGTLWTLASISFLAVYRELFETILFYEALGAQSGPEGHGALVAGLAVGAVLLAICAWAIIRYSARLPLSLFFNVSAVLLALLAVVFTGQGVAALQEAGWLSASRITFPTVPLLGLFPTLQSIGAQLAVAAIIGAVIAWSRHREARAV